MSSERARELRQEGIKAAKAGNKDEARRFLQEAIRLEADNEAAWLWMASLARDKRERLFCLKKLLEINPRHEAGLKAARGMGVSPEQLLGQAAPPPIPPPPIYTAQPDESAVDEALAAPLPTPGPAGIPVPDPQHLGEVQEDAGAVIEEYLVSSSPYDDMVWAHKEKRRAGERDILVLRLQVTAAVIAFLFVLAGIGVIFVANSPEAQAVLFAPTWTVSPTSTPTPTATLGVTPTPSMIPELSLTPSPTINPRIRPGSEDRPPRATNVASFLPESPSNLIREAVVMLEQNDPESALPLLEEEQAINPAFDPNPYYYQAMAYLQQGELETALTTLQAAEREWEEVAPLEGYGYLFDVGFAEIHLALGQAALDNREANRQFDEAERRALSAIEFDPQYTPAYVVLARSHLLREDYDAAIGVLNDGLQFERLFEDLNLRLMKGEVYYAQGEYDLARQEAYEMLYINPYSEPGHHLQIRSVLALGDAGLGVIYSEQYLFFYPGRVQGYKFLGDARMAENKSDLALTAYERALLGDQSDPAIVDTLLARAELYTQQRRFDLADEDYLLAYNLTDDPEIRALRMKAAYQNGNYSIALNDADELLGMDIIPDAEIMLLQAQIMVIQAQPDEVEDFAEVRRLINASIGQGLDAELLPVANEYLAQAEYHLGNHDEALAIINRALDAADTGSRHYLRGLILEVLEEEEPDGAIAEFEWVLMWSEIYPYPFRVDAARHLAELTGVSLEDVLGSEPPPETTAEPEMTAEPTEEPSSP